MWRRPIVSTPPTSTVGDFGRDAGATAGPVGRPGSATVGQGESWPPGCGSRTTQRGARGATRRAGCVRAPGTGRYSEVSILVGTEVASQTRVGSKPHLDRRLVVLPGPVVPRPGEEHIMMRSLTVRGAPSVLVAMTLLLARAQPTRPPLTLRLLVAATRPSRLQPRPRSRRRTGAPSRPKPVPVTLDGNRGLYLEVTIPAEVDAGSCADDIVSLFESGGPDGLRLAERLRRSVVDPRGRRRTGGRHAPVRHRLHQGR